MSSSTFAPHPIGSLTEWKFPDMWARQERPSSIAVTDFLTGGTGTYRPARFLRGPKIAVSMSGLAPQFVEETIVSALELLDLPENWDSYGSERVSLRSVVTLIDLLDAIEEEDLPAPSVVPTSGGGVQIEWHLAGVDLEIEAREDSAIEFYFFDRTSEDELEEEVSPDYSNLLPYFSKLKTP